MKKPAHSDTKVIINLSTEHKIQRNGELVAFLRLDKAPRTGGMNLAVPGSIFPSGLQCVSPVRTSVSPSPVFVPGPIIFSPDRAVCSRAFPFLILTDRRVFGEIQ